MRGAIAGSFWLAEHFLINLPLGILVVILGMYGITERQYPEHAARDPLGQVLSVVALGALAFGMIEAGENITMGGIALMVAAVSFALFAVVESRVERPLLPIALLRERAFLVVNFASFVLGFSYYSSLFFFSIFLQQIQHWSPVEAGWRMMPQFVMTLCVSLLFGRLNKLIPLRRLTAVGYGFAGLALLLMATATAQTPYWIVGVWFALLGVGVGLAVPATSIAVMSLASAELSGAASATMNALRQAGMTIGIALLGTLMSERAIHVFASASAVVERGVEQGVGSVEQIAREAITQHVFPNTSIALQDLFTRAMESGFHLAMLLAGLACFGVLSLLLMGNLHAGQRYSPSSSP